MTRQKSSFTYQSTIRSLVFLFFKAKLGKALIYKLPMCPNMMPSFWENKLIFLSLIMKRVFMKRI